MPLSILPAGTRAYLTVLTAVLGLVLGSAFHCLAWRLARGEKWQKGRSVCPDCGHVLSVIDLFPVFSWLILGGKCRYCRKNIPFRYTLAELLLAVSYTAILWHFGLSLRALCDAVLVSCLLCLSLTDYDVQEIPDRFLLIPAVCRLALLFYEGGLRGLWQGFWPGLVLGGALLLLSLIMDKVLKKESLGGGDIKLLAMLGLFFPLAQCLLLLVIACVIGLCFALLSKNHDGGTPEAGAMPFGPAISLAAFFTLLAGEKLVGWYLSLF